MRLSATRVFLANIFLGFSAEGISSFFEEIRAGREEGGIQMRGVESIKFRERIRR